MKEDSMSRKKTVFLVHWKPSELDDRVARLEKAGYAVIADATEGRAAGNRIKRERPDSVVIDLSRLPSHGRQLAVWLREQKSTRALPIVFVGGDGDKLERLKRDLPDAIHTTWHGIKGAIARAIASPPSEPVVVKRPDYSGTPLPKKLSIKPGAVLALLSAPSDFELTLGELPDGVRVKTQARGNADVIVLFSKAASDLRKRFASAQRALADGGGLWVAWPKKTSGVATDLDQGIVMKIGLASGLVDNKICAIDGTWSGLRFMRRRA
jgi:CheY-like chemotaxis protein